QCLGRLANFGSNSGHFPGSPIFFVVEVLCRQLLSTLPAYLGPVQLAKIGELLLSLPEQSLGSGRLSFGILAGLRCRIHRRPKLIDFGSDSCAASLGCVPRLGGLLFSRARRAQLLS